MKVLQYISQSRAQLMAFAIVGVLLVHSGIQIPVRCLNALVQRGYGGVDLFFFLSGFGLYYSCRKESACLPFWWKRLKRIMPGYVACIVISQLVLKGQINWTHLWQDCCFIGYWIKPLKWHYFAWFISGIMGLYLVFPLYYKAFRRNPVVSTLLASLTGLILAGIYSYYFLVLHPKGGNAFIHLFARMPIFFVGVLMAYLCEKEKRDEFLMRKGWVLLMLLMPLVGYEILKLVASMGYSYQQQRNSGWTFYPFILIIPGLAVSLGYVLGKLPSVLRTLLAWVGNSTLEAYLLLAAVFHYKKDFISFTSGSNILGCLLMVLSCVVVACLLHYGLHYLFKLHIGRFYNLALRRF